MKTVGFIGAGNMAYAIGNPLNCPILLYDKKPEASARFTNHQKKVCTNLADLVAGADIIVLSVKPQNFEEVLTNLATLPHQGKLFCTIAAGISISYLERMLGSETHILRAMPNTPLLVGMGAVALCKNKAATEDEWNQMAQLFAQNGVVCRLDESQMNKEVALHGSSPAIFFEMAALAQDYGKSIGMSEEDALNLFAATMAGSAKLLTQSNKSPKELSQMVCSPGGTTLAMLDVLRKQKAGKAFLDSFDACTKRAEELSQ